MTAYAASPDPTAVMGRRYGAYIVDSLIAAVLVIVAFASSVNAEEISRTESRQAFGESNLCNAVADRSPSERSSNADFDLCTATIVMPSGARFEDRIIWYDGTTNRVISFSDTAPLWLIGGAYQVLVFWVLQGLTGATPGKALFGIRVVNERGERPGIGRAALRSILWVVDGIGCCVPLVGPITAGVTKGHRRVGDMAAKTFVVGRDAVGYEVAVPGLTPPGVGATPPYAGGTPGFPPSTPAPGTTPSTGVADPTIGWGASDTPGAVMGVSTPDASPAAAGGSEPQWDPARNAYIQWDATRQAWLQYDDATGEWRPIQ